MSLLLARLKEISMIKQELAERNWFPGTSGNLSIKITTNPTTFLVTASGKDKTKHTPDDFILVDEQGNPIEETDAKVSAETALHVEVYKRTSAGCCLHVHTVDNNIISELYGDQGQVVIRNQELIKAFGIWEQDAQIAVPIIENLADLNALADLFGNAIRPQIPGVLIRNHGITAWGKNGFEAKKHLEALEFLFSYEVKLQMIASSKIQYI
ncbi:methylthioribulose 1-phosphate dehydratase [Shimazuella sp. AN120528]|uniref:methylthioribulose 1-phosphate dehydratase n=1 Tax=Shimazuella soli TaxID=1892854 RepID=UPI001F10D047|nr:methylthioribulose 1-phosphate dehydratase [Shimazuella soli]MCH5583987.1 methylthioribulose 1-phosphate dehydratase [Shimazuella soli]